MLTKYNDCFKRKERVQLVPRWDSDSGDDCADINEVYSETESDHHKDVSFMTQMHSVNTTYVGKTNKPENDTSVIKARRANVRNSKAQLLQRKEPKLTPSDLKLDPKPEPKRELKIPEPPSTMQKR